MSQSPLTERVRQVICEELARSTGQSEPPLETLLIREGLFCGRRFELGEHEAVWFIEEDQVKFYGPDGQLRKTLTPSQALAETPNAAPLPRAA